MLNSQEGRGGYAVFGNYNKSAFGLNTFLVLRKYYINMTMGGWMSSPRCEKKEKKGLHVLCLEKFGHINASVKSYSIHLQLSFSYMGGHASGS